MLKICELNKSYGKKVALIDFTAEFENGLYGLLGPNGAGKSTFMNILAGVIKSNSGDIFYNDINIKELKAKFKEKIGYLPQNVGLYNNFTAEETLKYFGTLRNVSKENIDKRVDYCLEAVNLIENKKDKVGTFSGGMKRRMAIAITLIADPDILIFDEPTVGLDPKERIRFRELLLDLKDKKTIILSSHIVSDIKEAADYVLFLKEGNLVYQSEISKMDIETKYMEIFKETE